MHGLISCPNVLLFLLLNHLSQAAESAISYGFAGLGGLFTGIFFMYTYGMLLSMWLSTEFQHMR